MKVHLVLEEEINQQNLFNREILYSIVNRIDDDYFVEPVIDSDGNPVSELEESKDFSELVGKISQDAVNDLSNRKSGHIFRFSDLIRELSDFCKYDLEKLFVLSK